MFTKFWRHGRWPAALVAVCAAAMLTAGGSNAGAATVRQQATVQRQVAVQQQSKVPWAAVGSGWELAQYTNSTRTKAAATTLYLISPGGTRYSLYTWRASANFAPGLVAWSGDKTRALLSEGPDGQVARLNLVTGKLSRFRLAGQASAIGYTRPDGLNILGRRVSADGSVATLARYNLAGELVKNLATSRYSTAAVYSSGGTTLAVSGKKGLQLISNAGGVIRQLPVPGTDPVSGCTPMRWWNAGTVLATCDSTSSSIARLWLVPASGAKPVALTPQRKDGPDLGDIDAWRLTSGLYLQSLGACGTLELNQQAANGSVAPVNVPGTGNTHNLVVTALGSRLLIDAGNGCEPGNSLLWYNPGRHAEQWLLKAPANAYGVLAVVPYYSSEDAPAL
jgi:hypothetical protein